MAKSYELDMTGGSVMNKLLAFSLPLMASGVLQLLFNAADLIVVGRFAGDNSLGAVGATSSLINLLTNIFVGLSVGVNVAAARAHGAGHKKDLSAVVHTAMFLSVICGALLCVIGVVFAPMILELMKTPDEQLPLAALYLRIYFLGMPAMMVYNFGAALLRSVGDTKRPLYFLMTAGVINVLLNLAFVILFHMDVAGVAAASAISQCVSAVLVVLCLLKEPGSIRLRPKRLHIDGGKLREIMRIGLPAGFQGVVFSLSNVVIQSSVNLFGNTVVSGNSAAANIEGFVYMAMNTFHQAAITFTSRHVGAKRYDRIPRIMLCSMLCVFVTGAALGWAGYLFGRPLLGIYSEGEAVIEAGLVRMSFILTDYFLCGMMDVMVGMLRGLGCSITPMIVSLAGACGLRLVWIATIFQIPEYHTIKTVYASYPVSWAVTLAAHLVCFAVVWGRLKKREPEFFKGKEEGAPPTPKTD